MLQLAVNEFTWDHYRIDTVLWEHRQQPWADVAADYPLVFAQRPVTRQNLRLELPYRVFDTDQADQAEDLARSTDSVGLYLEDRRRPKLARARSPDHRCPGYYSPAPRFAQSYRPGRRPAIAGGGRLNRSNRKHQRASCSSVPCSLAASQTREYQALPTLSRAGGVPAFRTSRTTPWP